MTMASLDSRAPKRPLQVVRTRVFAAAQGGGNPCPVVLHGERLTDKEMLAIAARYGEEAAFLLPSSMGGDIRIRYFLPDHELGVSGHATIAAVAVGVAWRMLERHALQVETKDGMYPVSVTPDPSGDIIRLEQERPIFGNCAQRERVAAALNIDKSWMAEHPLQNVSVSRPKLMVPLCSVACLENLKPNYERLDQLCEDLSVSGVYVFTVPTDKPHADVEARQFPFHAGYPEDAATGVAAVALAAYIFTHVAVPRDGENILNVAQGYTMGCPSRIGTSITWVDGKITKTAMFGHAQILDQKTS